jgi:hypothetical protein
MQALDDLLGGRSVYAKYESNGAHNRRLLDALGIPPDLAADIWERMDSDLHVNPRMTQKQAVICLNLDLLSRRSGVTLDRRALRDAVYHRELDFEGDRPCELMDGTRGELCTEMRWRPRGRRGSPPTSIFSATPCRQTLCRCHWICM